MSGLRNNLRMLIVILAVILVIVFLLQNTKTVPVKFLFFDETDIPSVVLIMVTLLFGFVVGYFLGGTRSRRKAQALEQQRSSDVVVPPTPSE